MGWACGKACPENRSCQKNVSTTVHRTWQKTTYRIIELTRTHKTRCTSAQCTFNWRTHVTGLTAPCKTSAVPEPPTVAVFVTPVQRSQLNLIPPRGKQADTHTHTHTHTQTAESTYVSAVPNYESRPLTMSLDANKNHSMFEYIKLSTDTSRSLGDSRHLSDIECNNVVHEGRQCTCTEVP
jgi:hypothetical protein